MGRRWEGLDAKTTTTETSRHLFALFRMIPSAVWAQLQKQLGDASRLAALRSVLLLHFRRWGQKTLGADARGLLFSVEQRRRALQYLTALVHTLVPVAGGLLSTTPEGVFARLLRAGFIDRAVSGKRERFWGLRELPRLRKDAAGATDDILARENNVFYRR